MRCKIRMPFLAIFLLVFMLLSSGCRRAPAVPTKPTGEGLPSTTTPLTPKETAAFSPTVEKLTQTVIAPSPVAPSATASTTSLPYPYPSGQAATPNANSPSQSPYPGPISTKGPQITSTPSPTSQTGQGYPGPVNSPTVQLTQPYPGPGSSPTAQPTQPYPGPVTPTPPASRTPARSVTPTRTAIGTPSPTRPTGSVTPATTPIEPPLHPPMTPPPAGSSVTIWHSWGTAETEMLQSIIQSFQRSFPDVTFSLKYYPEEQLLGEFYSAAYFGQGPALLLGPSAWGSHLSQEGLVVDLSPYVPAGYFEDINRAALDSSRVRGTLVSLPLSINGVLMFRNTAIIPDAPTSFDELIESSQQATHGGIVGSYLDRGAYFSAPTIIGIGGGITNEGGYPVFDDSFGLEWMSLLAEYDNAGAVTFNTNLDLDMFKKGRVGIIIDGSWNISALEEAIGADKLAIDPWPTYAKGHLSGWVQADSVYLNANSAPKDQFAALSFIGYLLDPEVQKRLAEVGHIPAVISTQPRDTLIMQAMQAFSTGSPYPNMADDWLFDVYIDKLDRAIQAVFGEGLDPASALHQAKIDMRSIIRIIKNRQASP